MDKQQRTLVINAIESQLDLHLYRVDDQSLVAECLDQDEGTELWRVQYELLEAGCCSRLPSSQRAYERFRFHKDKQGCWQLT